LLCLQLSLHETLEDRSLASIKDVFIQYNVYRVVRLPPEDHLTKIYQWITLKGTRFNRNYLPNIEL